jgi:hypothetical protein
MENFYNDCDRHVYLYAKHHYEKSDDIVADLQKIIGERNCIDPKDVHLSEIYEVLLSISYDVLMREKRLLKYQLIDFVTDCNNRGIILACLRVIQNSLIAPMDIDLGEADPNILPIRK